jgi:spore coat polysaccharide biosynthesis predicted glycosyltransferase SpsG
VHEADVLLDQNYSTGETDRYRNLLPRHASRLFGPAYALLHPAYAGYRQRTRPWNGIVERVLIFFGGSDPDNMTGMALESLSSQELQELSVDVIVGANNPHRSSIELLAQKRPGTTLYGPRPHLADLMAKADLGLGAGGVTTWERCCLGLPSLLVSIAENQRPACESLARDGLICYAGHWDGVTAEKLNAILMELIRDPVALRQMASSCLALVDGQGTSRVADHLAC